MKDKASIFDCILPSEAAISSAGDCDSELADENDLMRIRELAIIKQAIIPIIIFFNSVAPFNRIRNRLRNSDLLYVATDF